MKDIRPFIRGLAGQIARESMNTGEKLASLVAKVASSKDMSDDMIKTLNFETNQAFRAIYNKDDFEMSKMPEVIDLMHSGDRSMTKVAYAYREYTVGAPSFDLGPQVDLLPDNSKSDFKAVFRELSRKSAHAAKQKRAGAYLNAEEEFSKALGNIGILKTLGLDKSEICDSLSNIGLSSDHIKHASALYDKVDKRASSGSTREYHNVDGYMLGLKESLQKFASFVEEYKEADGEFNRAQKAQEVTYKQERILL